MSGSAKTLSASGLHITIIMILHAYNDIITIIIITLTTHKLFQSITLIHYIILVHYISTIATLVIHYITLVQYISTMAAVMISNALHTLVR